jgi:hypothetical protein
MFARFWTAPVLWRFGDGFEMDDGRSFVSRSGFKARITFPATWKMRAPQRAGEGVAAVILNRQAIWDN